MQICPSCRQSLPEINRFCTRCGQRLAGSAPHSSTSPPSAPPATPDQLNLNVLYGMVGTLNMADIAQRLAVAENQGMVEVLAAIATKPLPTFEGDNILEKLTEFRAWAQNLAKWALPAPPTGASK